MIHRMIGRKSLLGFLLFFVLVGHLSACSISLPQGGEVDHYELSESGATEVKFAKLPQQTSLQVREATANRFINSLKILFREEPPKVGFYKYAAWIEPPPKQLTTLLLRRLQSSQFFSSVSRTGDGTVADLQLNLEVEDFVHEAEDRPGVAVVSLRLDLLDLDSLSIIAQEKITETEKVRRYNSESAVSALNTASNRALDKAMRWLIAAASAQ